MAVLIGQVFYPRYKEEKKDNGDTKTSFTFSLGTRKAFVEDDKKPNVFTPAVTYQASLAKILNNFFGKEEHHGKTGVFYGHYNEFEWYPDPNNSEHDKYFQEFNITEEYLTAGGVKFAEGSAREMTVYVPVKQITRQFVVTGFEFADSNTPTKTNTGGSKSNIKIKVGGQPATNTSADSGTSSEENKGPVPW